MPSVLESMSFGLKKYMEKGAFGALKELNNNKSNFGKKDDPMNGLAAGALLVVVLLMIVSVILGWLAVSHICKGTDNRSKNIRLGLYAILLFTGGGSAWIYIILWLLKVNVCA
jgi:hypothetical protein